MKIGNQHAVILCNGEPPAKKMLRDSLSTADLFVAADGGGNTALSYNLLPDIVIGDLDSYLHKNKTGIPVLHKPNQDENDLEKALIYLVEKEMDTVIVYGATGRRLDHTVKNLSVLKQFRHRFSSLIFRDAYHDIKLITSPHTEQLLPETQVSLFPLSGKVTGVTSNGLKYPLNGQTLENGVFDGTSNESLSDEILITFESGDLLLFINHKTD